MRKLLLLAGAVISVAHANAAEIDYRPAPVQPAPGFSLTRSPDAPDIFASGQARGATLGYDLGNGFRADLENLNSYTNRAGLSDGLGGVHSNSMMLRGMYEFDGGSWRLKPFVGAGLGMVNVNAGLLGTQTNDWVSAYQVRGGLNYALSQKLMGSVGYSWTDGEKPHLTLNGIPAQLKFPAGGVFLGLNYKLR